MNIQEDLIKVKMLKWLNTFLYQARQQGTPLNRTDIARMIGCSRSCLSQYTNPSNSKKAPWEFQCKLCYLVGKTIDELHPSLNNLKFKFKF